MGLVDYYRRLIRNFSQIYYSIPSLQRKGKNFEWTEESEANFGNPKQFLTHSIVLKIVDPNREFVACTYACKRGLGRVLNQEGHVVCYESWKLNENK